MTFYILPCTLYMLYYILFIVYSFTFGFVDVFTFKRVNIHKREDCMKKGCSMMMMMMMVCISLDHAQVEKDCYFVYVLYPI